MNYALAALRHHVTGAIERGEGVAIKEQPARKRFEVVQYRHGKRDGALSGMGKNKGTWDSDHSRSAAYYHAAALRRESWRAIAGLTYKVEEV